MVDPPGKMISLFFSTLTYMLPGGRMSFDQIIIRAYL